MSRARIVPILFSLFSMFWFASVLQAQTMNVTDTTSAPVPGVGHDYIHQFLRETVNPANGSASLRIDAPMPKGRGLTIPFAFSYNSNGLNQVNYVGNLSYNWIANQGYLYQGGWRYSLPSLTYRQNSSSSSCYWGADYVFTDPSSVPHSLYIEVGYTYPVSGGLGFCGNNILTGTDGQYSASTEAGCNNGCGYFQQGPVYVSGPDGTVYSFGGGGFNDNNAFHTFTSLASPIEDRNGNVVGISQNANGSFAMTDTVGRTGLSSSGFGPSGTTNTITIAGLSNPYQITWQTVSSNYQVPSVSEFSQYCGSAGLPPVTNSQVVVQSITLPNGQKYQFSYDSTYGLLKEILYPSGGWVKYTWKPSDQYSEQATFSVVSSNYNGPCIYDYSPPVVATRTVSFDGSSPALTQSFQYTTAWQPNAGTWYQKTTTVTTTDNIANTTSATTYTYTAVPVPSQPGDNNAGQIPVETQIQYGSGTTLRTETKNWFNYFQLACDFTTLDNGQVSGAFYTYGAGSQITDKRQYDQLAAAACQNSTNAPSSPTPLRETCITYQTFANTPIFPGPSIFDLPASVIIYGNGTRVAETDYAYDQTPVSGVPNLPAGTHDETNYSPSYNNRGNATTITKQCFIGSATCTNSVTTFTYDETSQAVSMTDPCGNAACSDVTGTNHTTTYSYTDNYSSCGGSAPPSGSTNAYLTSVTDPLGHVQSYCYGYDDGQLRGSTDANSQTTTYKYNDALRRLTETDYPDFGQTRASYNDNAPNPTVTTSRKLDTSGRYVTSTATMDGLGHVIKTLLTPDPDCASGDRTDTTYDGLGRVYTVSNPYCSTSDPSYGLTTNVYDALGRTCLVVPPDGTLPSGNACPTTQPSGTVFTTYSGNTTTMTDEAGKKRQSTADSLGRLTQVTEDPGGLGYITNYTYDALDNLLSVVQNGSRPRTFTYDSLSRLTQAINPESGTTTYSYDANGNLTGKTDARNISVGYSYDALNRLSIKSYSPTFAIAYYYDQTSPWGVTLTNPIGRLTTIGTYDGTCWPTASTFGYDAMGRVTFQEDYLNTAETSGCPGNWTTVNAGYDLAGNQTSLTYPSGRVIKSQYSGVSRLTNLKVDDLNGYNYLSSATYAPNGVPATFALGNGLIETSTYNKRFQPNDLKVAGGSSTLLDHIYNFNLGHDNGNVMSIADNIVSGRTQNFAYDSLNRLYTAQTTATSGSDCWGGQFGYDAWGNLLTSTPTNCTFYNGNFSVNANNQLTNTGYDAAGNMTNDGSGNTYAYDAENHLISFNGAATYIYDAQGRRMAKKIGSATTEYIYFNGNVISEYSRDQVWSDYIFAGGRRLAAAGTDDIFNPGFEQGMEGWSWGASDSSGTAQVITDSARAHSGNSYLQLSSVTANSVSAGQIHAVNPGDNLTFGGWAYIEPGSASATSVAWDIAVLDANGNVLAYYGSAVTTQGAWTYLSTNYTVPTGGASVSLYCQIYQPTGAITARFDDAFLTGASGLGVHYYHADHLGSARLMTDSAGNQTWSATYLPFGQEWNPLPTTNHYKFTGKERDSESGLDNFDFRYYSSSLGRFTSPDPVGGYISNPQSLNRYTYVLNNPLNLVDPFGLQDDSFRACISTEGPFCDLPLTIPPPSSLIPPPPASAPPPVDLPSGAPSGNPGAGVGGSSGSNLNTAQLGLGLLGAVPGIVGTGANLINAGISLYRGNYGQAALNAIFAIPFVGTIGELGRAGEVGAGIIKNTERIESLTGTAAFRIPDELSRAEKIIGEVKNVSYQTYTRQLRDYVAYAQKYDGYQFRLYVRQGTRLSAPLMDAVEEGLVNLIRNLP